MGKMGKELLIALCLVLVIEGIMPFVSPSQWRQALGMLIQLDDKKIRTMGLVSMLVGTALLYWVH
jgi:uncharacterized protein YjeT (DUF2065 family)